MNANNKAAVCLRCGAIVATIDSITDAELTAVTRFPRMRQSPDWELVRRIVRIGQARLVRLYADDEVSAVQNILTATRLLESLIEEKDPRI